MLSRVSCAGEAVLGLQPDLLARRDLRHGLDVRVPAVVHQISSATLAAAARHAAISSSVQCRGEPSWWSETMPAHLAVRHHRRDDLGREAAVGLAHPVEGGVVGGGRAVVLHDLPAPPDLDRDRLAAQVDRPLLHQRARSGGKRLVGDRERVLARACPVAG